MSRRPDRDPYRVPLPTGAVGDVTPLRPADARHLGQVLRMRAGDEVEGFDGQGWSCRGVVETLTPGEGTVRIVAVHPPDHGSGPPLTLALAAVRPERMDWAVQKLTELGVTGLVPLAADRAARREPLAALARRRERWERVVTEALKQCRRNDRMWVHPPESATEWLARPGGGRRLILHPEGATPLWDHLDTPPATGVTLAIGPEGGWSVGELTAATAGGFVPVRLGQTVLRAETAALAAASLAAARLYWSR